ncbi:50S ribosomal protein L31e [Candidatus Micrarchaeota archaeon]|nr:50S ribosomal protein L31e [Candidatus Micrarchaeota archaeon]
MVDKIERLYTIPLRGAYDYKRNKRAIRAIDNIKEFIARHMKANLVKVSNALNASIWSRGISKPPRKVKVKAVKDGDKTVVYLPDEKLEEKKEAEKQPEKQSPESNSVPLHSKNAKAVKSNRTNGSF